MFSLVLLSELIQTIHIKTDCWDLLLCSLSLKFRCDSNYDVSRWKEGQIIILLILFMSFGIVCLGEVFYILWKLLQFGMHYYEFVVLSTILVLHMK